MKTAFLLSFLLIAAYTKVTPSPDFNLTDFPGTWNLIGLSGLSSQNMTQYACATMNVTIQGALNILTLSESWIISDSFVTKDPSFVPSPLNNAILISSTSPSPQNNFVVAYYNSTSRQAVLINQAATAAFVLSKSDLFNDAHYFLTGTASSVLTDAGMDPTSLLEIYSYNCDYGKLTPLVDFYVSSVIGKEYYANVIFSEQGTTDSSDDKDYCSTLFIETEGDFLNITYTKGQDSSADNETVLPYPGLPAVFIDTAISYSNPLVITYQDTENDVILIFREPVAIGLSTKTTMSPVLASNIILALESQGFEVNTTNFLTIPSSCYPTKTMAKTGLFLA